MNYCAKAFTILAVALAVAALPARAEVTLTEIGEILISKMPAPSPTKDELSSTCKREARRYESKEVAKLLESRRAYLFALNVWGAKWLPTHAGLGRGTCTDYGFLLKQYQRAHGADETGYWTRKDVETLISEVEGEIKQLVHDGKIDEVMLEPIPDSF